MPPFTLSTEAQPSEQPRTGRFDGRYLLYFYLHAMGWLATTLLVTWGLFVFFFLVIGGFSFDGLMHQLNNLASRYVAADAARTAHFSMLFFTTHMLLVCGVMFFRRHSILPPRRPEGTSDNG